MSTGRTDYTLDQLVNAANELNRVLKLKPSINLHLDKDDMEDHLLEACRIVNLRSDKLTIDTENIVRKLRRNYNKYVRFQQAKTIRVSEYLKSLLKQERHTRNQIANLAKRYFRGGVSESLIQKTLSYGRHPNHKFNKFGKNMIMIMDPVTKVERLEEIDKTHELYR